MYVSLLLMFSNVEITPMFSVDHKCCTWSHNFSHSREIYKETFDKILFQNKVLHPNSGRNKVGIVIIAAQEVSRILSHNLKSCRESPDQQK